MLLLQCPHLFLESEITNFPEVWKDAHPEPDDDAASPCMRTACKYGTKCYQRDKGHLARFAHPGDRNYRLGLVEFPPGFQPEFESLWQLFRFHDPDESGHLSKEEFRMLLLQCPHLFLESEITNFPEVWKDAGGEGTGYLNFRMFTAWSQKYIQMDLPLGLEVGDASSRPCRFRLGGDGPRCGCQEFQAAGGDGPTSELCVCGHKASMHRSDLAQRTMSAFLEEGAPSHWSADAEGLVEITEEPILSRLQALLHHSHKTTDNWTRDRGCSLHGVNGCSASCASRNRVLVPSKYNLVTAFRNQNQDLWQKYALVKTAVAEECSATSKAKFRVLPTATNDALALPRPMSVGDFTVGEAVEVWSNGHEKWLPGEVLAIYSSLTVEEGSAIQAGTVKVGSEAGVKFVKYVPPDHVSATVRKPCSVEGEALDPSINEWYLFHGSRPEALANILVSNFRLTLAGSGATWKDAGKASGTPLYGFGIYFAERITKADEYAAQVKERDPLPVSPDGRELFCVLLCRVVGGRTNLVTTNEIEREKLRSDVFDGPYHSVFGDRVSSLGKPYKEVVVYDKDQVFPEYLLVYSRSYG